jgi:hypothetical protein
VFGACLQDMNLQPEAMGRRLMIAARRCCSAWNKSASSGPTREPSIRGPAAPQRRW